MAPPSSLTKNRHTIRASLVCATIILLAGCVNAPDSNSAPGASSDEDAAGKQASAGGNTSTHEINGSVHVTAGEKTGDVSTVNGSIHVDENAAVTSATTVNGGITVAANSTAEELKAVNGGVTLGHQVHVAHSVNTVNGGLTLEPGADVAGSVGNVNGNIQLKAAHVGGGIETTSGDIDVGADSHVEGGIHVHKQESSWFNWGRPTKPRIIIGPGAVVQGDLRFDRDVSLYVSDRATIGPVSGATPMKFSGDGPPAG